MVGSSAKKPMDTGQKRTWARQEGEGLHLSNAQSKEDMESRERKPKGPCIFHAVGVKQNVQENQTNAEAMTYA